MTDREFCVLEFVRARCDEGCSPTLREIMAHFGWTSTNAPRCVLYSLMDQGKVTRDERWSARPWRVVRAAMSAMDEQEDR